jgi:hypothetical protein
MNWQDTQNWQGVQSVGIKLSTDRGAGTREQAGVVLAGASQLELDISRRVHKWTRLEGFERAGRGPPLVREVNSRTSPHLRAHLELSLVRLPSGAR